MSERSVEASAAIEVIAARFWIGHIGKDGQWSEREDPLSSGPIDAQPLRMIRRMIGTRAEIAASIEALQAALPAAEVAGSYAEWLAGFDSDTGDGFAERLVAVSQVADSLRAAIALLSSACAHLAETEAKLAADGLRWDPTRDRLQWIPEGKKPEDYITKAIQSAWRILHPIHKRDTGDAGWSTQPLREWIAEALRNLPEDLDPGSGGVIDNVIGNMHRQRRR